MNAKLSPGIISLVLALVLCSAQAAWSQADALPRGRTASPNARE